MSSLVKNKKLRLKSERLHYISIIIIIIILFIIQYCSFFCYNDIKLKLKNYMKEEIIMFIVYIHFFASIIAIIYSLFISSFESSELFSILKIK